MSEPGAVGARYCHVLWSAYVLFCTFAAVCSNARLRLLLRLLLLLLLLLLLPVGNAADATAGGQNGCSFVAPAAANGQHCWR
jgi:succinate-acetate transporter protein